MAPKCIRRENETLYQKLAEWEEEVVQKGNLKLRFVAKKAMRSIKNAMHPIRSAGDAKELDGIGDFIAAKISKWLTEVSQEDNSSGSNGTGLQAAAQVDTRTLAQPLMMETAPWYVLMGMWELQSPAASDFTKNDIRDRVMVITGKDRDTSNKLCLTSLKDLLSKLLVEKIGEKRSVRYKLTEEGLSAASEFATEPLLAHYNFRKPTAQGLGSGLARSNSLPGTSIAPALLAMAPSLQAPAKNQNKPDLSRSMTTTAGTLAASAISRNAPSKSRDSAKELEVQSTRSDLEERVRQLSRSVTAPAGYYTVTPAETLSVKPKPSLKRSYAVGGTEQATRIPRSSSISPSSSSTASLPSSYLVRRDTRDTMVSVSFSINATAASSLSRQSSVTLDMTEEQAPVSKRPRPSSTPSAVVNTQQPSSLSTATLPGSASTSSVYVEAPPEIADRYLRHMEPEEGETADQAAVEIPAGLHENGDTWKVVLIVDTRETFNRQNKAYIEAKLRDNNVTCEVRQLSLGDFLWIAKRFRPNAPTTEFVLDFIVERKEVSDLASSVVDGRYMEQKHRLVCSGLKNVVYLLEGSPYRQDRLPATSLLAAMDRTQVENCFMMKCCDTVDETARFLAQMHTFISKEVENCVSSGFSPSAVARRLQQSVMSQCRQYIEFDSQSRKSKPVNVGLVWLRMLKQLPGSSAQKAEAIAEVYPTLRSLLDAYKTLSSEDAKAQLLSDIRAGPTKRRIGPRLSLIAYQIYRPVHRYTAMTSAAS